MMSEESYNNIIEKLSYVGIMPHSAIRLSTFFGSRIRIKAWKPL